MSISNWEQRGLRFELIAPARAGSVALPAAAATAVDSPPPVADGPSVVLGVGATTLAVVVGCALALGVAIGMRCRRARRQQQTPNDHELEEDVGLLSATAKCSSVDILRAYKKETTSAGVG